MKKSLLAGLVLAIATAGPSPAQVRMPSVQPATSVARPGLPAAAMIDRDALNERRLVNLAKKNRALEGRVATLEAALREMRSANEFSCSAPTVSRNGRGASEDCTPYACNYLDGRCRTTSVDSSQCAPDFYWDGNNHCMPPPRSEPDEECFLGLFC